MIRSILSITTVIFLSLFLLQSNLFAQNPTVELQDGTGTLISSHGSIQAAWDAIPSAVSQAYIIEILSNYDATNDTYPITLNEKSGASATNWVVIRPDAGATGLTVGGDQSGGEIIIIDGADYLTLDGRPGGTGSSPDLTIENTATGGSGTTTIEMINGATNLTLQYLNTFNGARDNAGPVNIYVSDTNTGMGNNNITIRHNAITGGRSAIRSSGETGVPNDALTIYNNVITEFGYAGIWVLSNTSNLTIDSCAIGQHTGGNTTLVFGMSLGSSVTGTNSITRNRFEELTSSSTNGPHIRGLYISCSDDAAIFNISNNFFALTADNIECDEMEGIDLSGSGDYTANIYHNTIRLGGTQDPGVGTAGELSSTGLNVSRSSTNQTTNIVNNIVLNDRSGGPTGVHHIGFFNGNLDGTMNIDYNTWFASAPADAYHAAWGVAFYTDLTIYQTTVAPQEQNTLFKSTEFVSVTDLHLTGTSIGDPDLGGTPVGILTDIDGDARDAVMPYKGADETTPIPVELASFSASVNESTVLLNWATATETNNYGFEIERAAANGKYVTLGFVEGSGTSTEIHTYSYTDANLAAGTYTYRLKQIDLSGAYEYFNLQGEVVIGLPQDYTLEQNYPNPFNPSTTISYGLPFESSVRLTIYDIRGAEVNTFEFDSQPAGFHQVVWNGLNEQMQQVPSGIYIYRFEARSLQDDSKAFVKSAKMTLLK